MNQNTNIRRTTVTFVPSKKVFRFDSKPNLAELWDTMNYKTYNIKNYISDAEKIFKKLNIPKNAKMIDVSVGGGFPSLDLIKRGWNIICADGFSDAVELFDQRAKNEKLTDKAAQVLWSDLNKHFKKESFDVLFCRGNSLISADGGWGSDKTKSSRSKAIDNYKETINNFYQLIRPGGWIYLDKFRDTEKDHYATVGEIRVSGEKPKKYSFRVTRNFDKNIRHARMFFKQGSKEVHFDNTTYNLSGKELELFLKEVGFRNIQKIKVPSETKFDVWIAQK